jgi:RNA polymerase sigma-70 factor, ECF subfamily
MTAELICRVASGAGRRLIAAMIAPPASSDEQLLSDILEVAEHQSLDAFRRLFDHYAPRVKAHLRRTGASDQVAEDLVQEVFLSVWRRANQFDPARAALGTWIFTIARNKRIDLLRRERWVGTVLDDPTTERPPPMQADDVAEMQQLRTRLAKAIDLLPPEQAELLKIFYYEEKTHSAIAEQLGLPLGTVKSRLRLALGKLRDAMGEGRDDA